MEDSGIAPQPRRRLAGRAWSALDALRRLVLNLAFVALLLALAAVLWSAYAARPKVPRSAALVVAPRGAIVEQLGVGPSDRLLRSLAGAPVVPPETLLRDLLDAIRAAKDDTRVKAILLALDDMGPSGLSKLQDLGAAIQDFRKSGKKVIAAADSYGQAQYYLAAQADEVFLNTQGMVILEGYGGFRQHYKEGLDRLGVDVNVFRVGEYKSAVEPFLRDDMSPETREALLEVYGDLWRSYLADVAAARKQRPDDLSRSIQELPRRVRAASGDLARVAREANLVDVVAPRDAVRKRLIALVGEDPDTKSFHKVTFEDYLQARGGDRSGAGGRGDAVAVIVARGDILDGSQPPGRIGGDSTSELIRKARQDEKVKALVLRVDSPGGSVFASEVIRRELEIARESGKPVVVSMGSVAASGGYWVATASDEIWASPTTITGSIGIFAVFPTIQKPLARYLGVHVDGVGTTPFTGALRMDRPLGPEIADVVQLAIDDGYEDFLARVGKARKMTREQVDRIARGRVWSGEDAQRLGLVDHMGSLSPAISSAATRARLPKDHRVWYVERERSLKERLLSQLLAFSTRVFGPGPWAAAARPDETTLSPVLERLASAARELERLALWNDPRGLYAHCLCSED